MWTEPQGLQMWVAGWNLTWLYPEQRQKLMLAESKALLMLVVTLV